MRKILSLVLLVCLIIMVIPQIAYAQDSEGNSIAEAIPIKLGSAVSGAYQMGGEKDYFKINTTIGGKYAVECTDDKSVVVIYDQYGNYVPGEVYKLLDANQTYYVMLQDDYYAGSYPRAYSIKVSLLSDDYADSIYEASLIADLENGISGAINYYRDEDCIKFTIKESGTYVLEGSGDIYLTGEMYYSNCISILSYGRYEPYGPMKITYDFDGNQTYILSIKGHDNFTGNYNIKLKKLVYIDDHGDDFTTSTSVQVGSEIQGIISSAKDFDFFSFTPTETGYYIINAIGNEMTYGYLYDTNKNIISTDLVAGGYFYMPITANLTAGKLYYIRIASYNSESLYKLSIKFVADDYGNDIKNAYTITDSGISGNIEIIGDEDYFAFTPKSDGLYTFKTSGSDGLHPTSCLYKSDGIELEANKILNPDYNTYGQYSLKRGTKYYLKVFSKSEGYGKRHLYGHYSVNIEYCFDDVANIFEYSMPLSLNSTLSGSIDYRGDIDVYSFTADISATYSIGGNPVRGSRIICDGYIYDSEGNCIASNVSIINSNFIVNKYLVAGKKYYIKVKNLFSDSANEDIQTGAYTLQLSLVPTVKEDINRDLVVNTLDLTEQSKFYNKKSDDISWDKSSDMNGDNIIDIFDLVQVAQKIEVIN